MAKFCGMIGFAEQAETDPGVWEEQITEHKYYGDVLKHTQRQESSGDVNDNINVANKISIVADLFATTNICAMRYVEFMGAKWKISNVDVQYPRLILSVGGVYNGEQT